MVDGFEREDGDLELALQAAEYRFAPHACAREIAERLGHARDLRLLGRVAMRDMRLLSLRGGVRERTPATLASAPWHALDAVLAPLTGDSALRGMAARTPALLAGLPESDERALLAEALLNFAPALIQAMPALSHRFGALFARAAASATGPSPAAASSPLLTSGGMTDSCFMWRAGSAAARTRLG